MFQPNLFGFFNLQERLKQMGISSDELNSVNRNNQEAVNDFAKKVMMGVLQNNPNVGQQIKQVAGNVCKERVDDVVKVIDGK